ncbi:MAG TPA: hypothetical protein VG870_04190 [Chitinophagaceae bacterium]|nr:hypothetical protein [Chitinophagaceae bacterium]
MDVRMDHTNDWVIAFLSGMLGGVIKFFSMLGDASFPLSLLHAGITATACGFLGMAGKALYGWCVRTIKKMKQ